jgi:heat shock protein HtpX
MAETPAPVLVYNRIDANRRNTHLLLVGFAAMALPLVWAVSQMLASILTGYTNGFDQGRPFQGNLSAQIVALCIVLLGAILLGAVVYLGSLCSSLLLWGTRARKLGRDEEPELRRTVENLCIGAGLPPPSLRVMESPSPNAFATGYDPAHASLVVSRGLLKLLDRRELSGVLAHELSHIGNCDTDLSTTLAAVVAVVRLPQTLMMGLTSALPLIGPAGRLIAAWILWVTAAYILFVTAASAVMLLGSRLAGAGSGLSTGQELAILIPGYVFVVAPWMALLLRKTISHQREFLADADAALLTRDPEGLALALAKVSAAAGTPGYASAATAHMFFIDPFPPSKWRGVFPSHPSVDARIALLTRMGDGMVEQLAAASDAGVSYRGEMLLRKYVPEIEPAAASRPEVDGETHYTRGTRVRLVDQRTPLYRSPDHLSAIVADLDGGAEVTILGTDDRFYHVRATDDQPGYIERTADTTCCQSDVYEDSPTGYGIHPRASAGPASTVQWLAGSMFRLTDHVTTLYAMPDGWSSVVRQLSAGEIVTCLGLEGNFARVRMEQVEGYVPCLAGVEALSAADRSGQPA